MPSTEPIERSTLRVTMTIVSPIASRAMIAAPESSCWTFVGAEEVGLLIVVAPTTMHEREHDAELAEAEQQLGDARASCAAQLGDSRALAASGVTPRPPAPCRWRRA